MRKLSLTLLVSLVIFVLAVIAQTFAPRSVPARSISVPHDVSPQLQKIISRPVSTSAPSVPKTTEEWKKFIRARDTEEEKGIPDLEKQFHVRVRSGTIAGVHIYHVTPESILDANRGRLLMHVHGGAYVLFGGLAATGEAILVAHYTRMETVSVDYRMPPDFPFPSAVDDSVAVWRELIKIHNPRSMALFGTSAGGGLTLATVLKLKELGVPLPGALMAGTPWADLSKTGDTEFTNEYIDNVLVRYDGELAAEARLYAGSHDLKEPLLSPVYGDLKGFPPTVLLSGTRDLFLSDTVRVHQKLLRAGVDAQLLVFEGESHAQYLEHQTPESAAALTEVAQFLVRHLDK
jgi:acetyl esterase/lipase